MVTEVAYIPIDGKGRPGHRRQRFFFVIDALLRSRQAAGLETGSHRPDEDVNMYLCELLCRYAEDPTGGAPPGMIFPHETDLFDSVADQGEARDRYLAYRYNADHLLVSLGIFGNAWLRTPREAAFPWAPGRREAVGRGRWYYRRAATYAGRLEEGRRGLDELLGKIEVGFEEYLRILETMRGEYFHLIRGFSPGEWFHLCQDLGVGAGPGN